MKTALIQEEPVVALFGLNQDIIKRLGDQLIRSGFSYRWYSLENPNTQDQDVYKSLVFLTGLETIETATLILSRAAESNKHTIVCLPFLPQLSQAVPELQQLWDSWFFHLHTLHSLAISTLTTAQFIFVDGWVDDAGSPLLSPSALLFSELSLGRYWQCRASLSFVTTTQLTQEVVDAMGRPGAMPSLLLRGESWDFFAISNQVAGLYEVLFHTSSQPIYSPVKFDATTPFSVQIKTSSSIQDNLVGLIAQHLPSPKEPSLFAKPAEAQIVQSEASPLEPAQVPENSPLMPVITESPLIQEDQPLLLGDQLERIFTKTRVSGKEKHLLKLQTTEKKAKKKLKHNKLLFIVGSVSSGISLATLLLGALFVFSTNLAKKQMFIATPEELLLAPSLDGSPQPIDTTIAFLNPQLRLVGQFVDHPLVNEAQSLSGAAKRIKDIRGLEQERKKLELAVASHILGQQPTSIGGILEDLVRLTQSSYTSMTQLQSIFIPSEAGENQNKDWYSNLNEIITQKKTSAGYLQSLSPLLPNLLGLEGKPRIYAVLFLNSSELRPTGGFVQAVALVTVEKGQITATQTLSSYEIDQRIGGVIDPPAEIKELLNEKSWYFRDSNWDPHHPASAERATWFIEKALGVTVDGVVSLPSTAFASLLETTGPLTLPQYNESLTNKNVQERLNFHAEVELTNQVKNYPSAVLDAFFQHILQKSSNEFLSVVSALPPLFSSGDIQFSLTSIAEQELFQPLRWSGSLVLPVCPSQFAQVPCVVDSIYQVESNVGVNRVNASVTRNVSQSIAFSEGRIQHKRATKLTNNATTNAWPSGQYNTYIRWYLPTKSVVDSIIIDGAVLDSSVIRSYQDHGLLVIGAMIEVPIQSSKTVVIQYNQPLTQPLPYSYFFFDQKQPGTETETYQVVVTKPSDSSVVRLAPNVLIEANTLTFEPDRDGHRLTAIQFK